MTATDLTIPTPADLEALTPADRWDLEEAVDAASETLREFNNDELRHWVEVEGKTQAEIGKLVRRPPSTIGSRCAYLGLEPKQDGRGGRPKAVIQPDNSNNGEVVEGEIVPDPPKRRERRTVDDDGPAHFLPDVMAEDALENVRTQTLHWFEQGRVVKDLLDRRKSLEPRSEEDRKAIKREAAVMKRVARRIEVS